MLSLYVYFPHLWKGIKGFWLISNDQKEATINGVGDGRKGFWGDAVCKGRKVWCGSWGKAGGDPDQRLEVKLKRSPERVPGWVDCRAGGACQMPRQWGALPQYSMAMCFPLTTTNTNCHFLSGMLPRAWSFFQTLTYGHSIPTRNSPLLRNLKHCLLTFQGHVE